MSTFNWGKTETLVTQVTLEPNLPKKKKKKTLMNGNGSLVKREQVVNGERKKRSWIEMENGAMRDLRRDNRARDRAQPERLTKVEHRDFLPSCKQNSPAAMR